MDIKKELSILFKNAINLCGYTCENIVINFSNKADIADFQFNSVFQIAKKSGLNPVEVATKIVENLNSDEYIFSVSGNGFINIKLTDKKLNLIANEVLKTNSLCIEKEENPFTVVLDYGGANVAKELHVGHLRSPIIGECIKRVNSFFGNKTISDTHLGDWGLQMGLTIAQMEEDGLLEYQFKRSNERIELTLSMLNDEYPKASKKSKENEEFAKKASDFSLKIQRGEEPYFSIYKEIRAISVEKIKQNYSKLNAEFDLWYGESTAFDETKNVIQIFKDKNLVKQSNGALIVEVAKEGEHILQPDGTYKNPMPPCIIEKSNGADLYATTDIATILMRNKEFNPEKIIYFADNRQIMHFEQVFRCCKLAGISPEHQQLIFIPFGTMKGNDGKPFKTRNGGMIRLEDIINLLVEKANEKLISNGLEKNDELALKIGVAAMKFGDLSNLVTKDYVFDLDSFSSFEGKTGPYIQYTATRIKSILNKSDLMNFNINVSTLEERKIIIEMLKLIDGIVSCYKDNTPHTICNAVYNLASCFSNFYNNIKVLSEQNENKKSSYLGICKFTLIGISTALNLLAIDIPERM